MPPAVGIGLPLQPLSLRPRRVAARGLAAAIENLPPTSETIATPQQNPPPSGYAVRPALYVLRPSVSNGSAAVPAPLPTSVLCNRPLPINLATALRLSDARPLLIAAAASRSSSRRAPVGASPRVVACPISRWAQLVSAQRRCARQRRRLLEHQPQSVHGRRRPVRHRRHDRRLFAPLAARQVLRSAHHGLTGRRATTRCSTWPKPISTCSNRVGNWPGPTTRSSKPQALVHAVVDALGIGLVSPIEAARGATLSASLKQSSAAGPRRVGQPPAPN